MITRLICLESVWIVGYNLIYNRTRVCECLRIKKKVLIVDDDFDAAESVKLILENKG